MEINYQLSRPKKVRSFNYTGQRLDGAGNISKSKSIFLWKFAKNLLKFKKKDHNEGSSFDCLNQKVSGLQGFEY
jgi:hypothetical protein